METRLGEKMKGYRDLSYLLKNMEPTHVPGSYIYATVTEEILDSLGSAPRLVFREDEAITVIKPINRFHFSLPI